MSDWISSLQAVKRLRDSGLSDPEATLGAWAEAGFLKSRAARGRFSYNWDYNIQDFPEEPQDSAPWPDIPSDFWFHVNNKVGNAVALYEAGTFAAQVEFEGGGDSEHIKLYGVTFHSDNLTALLNGVGERQETAAFTKPISTNAGRKRETERWTDFGAALALFVQTADSRQLRSTDAVYKKVAETLSEAGRDPLDMRTVKLMIYKARMWIEAEGFAAGELNSP